MSVRTTINQQSQVAQFQSYIYSKLKFNLSKYQFKIRYSSHACLFFWIIVGIKITTIYFFATFYDNIINLYCCKLGKINLYIHFRTNKISATAYVTKPERRFKG